MIIQIEKVKNGYVFRPNIGVAESFFLIQNLFNRLLLYFEGKSSHFNGEFYGRVFVEISKPEEGDTKHDIQSDSER